MALQPQVLKTRSLTALLFVGLMGLGLFSGPISYLLLFLFLLTAGWLEYSRLIDHIHARETHLYLLMGWILNSLAIGLFFFDDPSVNGIQSLRQWLILPLHLAGVILMIWGTIVSKSLSLGHWIAVAAGNVYLTCPLAIALDLYGWGPAPDAIELIFSPKVWWIVVAIATMWVNDTMAYLLGSLFGRTPFSKISPKKTWEGTLSGAIAATALVGWGVDQCYLDDSLSPLAGYLLIFSLAVAGTMGDLFESKLKRMAGVKDSGRLMPGHGGVLDRFDSLLFALPVIYVFLRALSLAY